VAEDDSIAVTTLPKLVLEESCLFDTAYDRIGWDYGDTVRNAT
jgi:hypothetical protein